MAMSLVDYTEAEGQEPYDKNFERLLGEGTFALQAHDPKSKVYFRNLRVKKTRLRSMLSLIS